MNPTFTQNHFLANTRTRFTYNGKIREGAVVVTTPTYLKLLHDDGTTKTYNYSRMYNEDALAVIR